jgi:carboxylesterase
MDRSEGRCDSRVTWPDVERSAHARFFEEVAVPLLPGAEPFSHEGGPVGALVLHGFTGSPASMRPLAEHLADDGLTVELPRLPGHGTTWRDLAVCRWDDFLSEADRALSSLRARCDTVVALGLSVGGSLCLRLAETRPRDLAGLVLVNPAVDFHHPAKPLLPLLRHVVPSIPGVINDVKKAGVDEIGYDRLPLLTFHSVVHDGWRSVRDDIARVEVPVLLLHSRVDHTVSPSDSAWILANLTTPDVTEVWLEHSFHVATLDNDAPRIHDLSLEFVHRVAPARTDT